jgi:nicotinamide-nucleotide amidase
MKQQTASIITIGDELLIGQTVDTNSAWMGHALNDIGIWVHRRVAVGDNREAILSALRAESRDADIILVTGGLGPTGDDITKAVLSEYFGSPLVENAEVLSHIKEMFASRDGGLLDRNLRQSWVPAACTVLANSRGTAPGMWFEAQGKVYVSLPGVPHEMQGIMTRQVLPRLNGHFALPAIVHRTLVTMGLGESLIAERLVTFEGALPSNIKLAYLPGDGLLKLRLTARDDVNQRTAEELEQHFGVLREILADITVADEDMPPEQWIGRLLKDSGLTVSTAESCTGGLIAHKITSVPGSSAYFKGTVVSYANEVKRDVLGVSEGVLRKQGAVSEETVKAMAAGVRNLMRTDLAVATSGIMGPDGGTPDKPVGTLWIATVSGDKMSARRFKLRYSRARNQEIAANYALNMLREAVLERTT